MARSGHCGPAGGQPSSAEKTGARGYTLLGVKTQPADRPDAASRPRGESLQHPRGSAPESPIRVPSMRGIGTTSEWPGRARRDARGLTGSVIQEELHSEARQKESRRKVELPDRVVSPRPARDVEDCAVSWPFSSGRRAWRPGGARPGLGTCRSSRNAESATRTIRRAPGTRCPRRDHLRGADLPAEASPPGGRDARLARTEPPAARILRCPSP